MMMHMTNTDATANAASIAAAAAVTASTRHQTSNTWTRIEYGTPAGVVEWTGQVEYSLSKVTADFVMVGWVPRMINGATNVLAKGYDSTLTLTAI
jgi:hypothetical protein